MCLIKENEENGYVHTKQEMSLMAQHLSVFLWKKKYLIIDCIFIYLKVYIAQETNIQHTKVDTELLAPCPLLPH